VPGAGGIRAGRAFIELFVEDGKITPGLQRTLGKMQGFANSMTAVGKQVGAVGLGIVSALGGAAKKATDFGSDVADLSQRVGLTAESASALAYAAGQSATSIGTLEVGMRNMQKTVVAASAGNQQAAAALDDIGLSAQQLAGLSPEQRLLAIADALTQIEDPGQQAASAMKIFGRGGAELLPLLQEGSSGIQAMMQKAVDLNLVMSGKSATAAQKFGDQLETLQSQFTAIVVKIGSALIPALSEAAANFEPTLKSVTEWISQNGSLVVSLGSVGLAIAGLGTAFGGLGSFVNATVGTVTTMIGVLNRAIPVLKSVLFFIRANPWTAAAAAVAFAGASYLALRDDAMEAQIALKSVNDERDKAFADALPVADRVAGPNPAEQQTTPNDAQRSQREKALAYAKQKAARESPDWMAAAQSGLGDTLRNVSNAIGQGLGTGADVASQIAGALDQALSKASQTVGSSTVGTFNGALAAQTLGVNSPEKQIAENTKDTVEAVQDLTTTLKDLFPAFT